jgi:hypothetical protein
MFVTADLTSCSKAEMTTKIQPNDCDSVLYNYYDSYTKTGHKFWFDKYVNLYENSDCRSSRSFTYYIALLINNGQSEKAIMLLDSCIQIDSQNVGAMESKLFLLTPESTDAITLKNVVYTIHEAGIANAVASNVESDIERSVYAFCILQLAYEGKYVSLETLEQYKTNVSLEKYEEIKYHISEVDLNQN